ncbi:MAG: M13 family metallopeptidase [Gemmatimonadota bacterium]|nr:M13 family metallopeptidase [Gemmatimonadota bacterium]
MQTSRRLIARLILAAGAALTAGPFIEPAAAQSGGRALGFDTANFDKSVRPQDDFFRYVNGGWLKRTEIPADASAWGAFNELRELSRESLHTIFMDAAKSSAAAGTEERKVGDLYATFMDTARVEQLGITPLQGELKTIAAIRSAADLPAAFAHFARLSVQAPLALFVGSDPKRSDVNIVLINQSGLGMPDRDYYLRTEPRMEETRKAYTAYMARLFSLAGQPDPSGAAARILALETAIATPQWDRARSRDRNATYNKMTVAELAALTPSFTWSAYLKEAGLTQATEVVVRQPDYLRTLDSIVARTPASTWREYITFKLLDNYANALPDAYARARFEFRGKTLLGQQEMGVRWKRAVDGVEAILGEPAGKLYVARHFKPEAKARMDVLVKNLTTAYRVGIDSLEWMSAETKAQAKDKLAKFTVKIGYPDKPRDYSALEIRRGDLLGNAMRSAGFQYDDVIGRLGKPVDRSRWGMTPQTVNAYYNPSNNEIVFPAGILQPPFFDVNADDAANYGAIGAVIGHEIGHGFDDQGRKSDGSGNLRDWWTATDAQAFDARATKLGAQYASINPIDDMHINPKLTMGENIGDLSGLAQAYRAYRISLGGKEPPVIGGFTGDQRLFIGYAQVWRTKFRDEALRQRLLTDTHSPGMYRAFVPLINNDAFARAFSVKAGDKMYIPASERVKIW